ncbi:MAG: hypothetical protein BGN85_03355 [Alphaproteobacteria bacterium 64-11]|nr:hypothetical protein [Alphaproteobacteria bacterium]OJU09547.1 MAG: hypothetical protein BGN85_03355 [Alphaproteobacteria bacterium 64-11]
MPRAFPPLRAVTPAMLALAGGGVFALAALLLGQGDGLLDTDSAMRLVEVRDLLNGQSWFDLTQRRMNVPDGLTMHWSRLVDAPLALLVRLTGSESFALAAWPLLLFTGLLFVTARLALALAPGRESRAAMAASVLLLLLCAPLFGIFAPGIIDHHGLELLLTATALLGLAERRPRVAATAVALALGVALESLPYAVVAVMLAALWLRNAPGLAFDFGVWLALAALAIFFAVVGLGGAPVCDAYSSIHAVLLTLGGAGLSVLARLPQRRQRLAGLVPLAAGLGAAVLLVNPACLGGPYAGMDPRLGPIFLARINEARPIWQFARMAPSEAIAGYGYGLFALLMTLRAPPSRARTMVLVFALAALAVATAQVRAVPFVIVFALPGLAAALAHLAYGRRLLLAVAVLGCSAASFTLAGAALEGHQHLQRRADAFRRQQGCAGAAAIALLQHQRFGRVAAFVDQGPAILARTRDGVLAGPYHRDAEGILDTYALFAGPDPRRVVARRGIDYVMTCSAAPDWEFYRAGGMSGGLVAELARGRMPSWLEPLGRAGDVALYRVRR